LIVLACWYVCDSRIWRWSFFIDQPSSMKCAASQSSNSGCVGGSPRGQSPAVRTMPVPK
jgi:hypothetical protein